MLRSALERISLEIPTEPNATATPISPANTDTTVVLASSAAVRLGIAWNVAFIVPKRYSVVIASAAITMITISPKL
jgi:hypothetical protein